MKKNLVTVLLAASVAAMAFGAVTAHAEEKDHWVIGMSQCNLGEPWRVAMNDQIAMAAAEHPGLRIPCMPYRSIREKQNSPGPFRKYGANSLDR